MPDAKEVAVALRAHAAVTECSVVQKGDALKAFVVLTRPSRREELETRSATREGLWTAIFDGAIASSEPAADPSLHHGSWRDSFTGKAIPDAEMRAFVDATATRLSALAPRRVLEIGCATGLLLFRLARSCERYVGVDLSARSLEHVSRVLATMPELAARVALEQRSALDLLGFEPASFDLVVIDSVVQYFPSTDYLLEVVRRAARVLAPGGTIFLGDLRSLPLVPGFHAATTLARLSGEDDASVIRARWRKAVAGEKELTLDPAFLAPLRRHVPEITGARIAVKRGHRHNELTMFRYDAWLTVGGPERPGSTLSWRSWEREGATIDRLRDELQSTDAESVAFDRIANARLAAPARALAWMESDAPLSAFGPAATTGEGVEPEALYETARAAGFGAHVGWSDSGSAGQLAAVFTRGTGDDAAFGGLARAARGHLPLAQLAHSPLRDRDLEATLRELDTIARGFGGAQVRVEWIDVLPRDADGLVDRSALEDLV